MNGHYTNEHLTRTGKGKRAISILLCLMLLFTMNGGAIGVFAAPAETEPLQITAAPQDAETPAETETPAPARAPTTPADAEPGAPTRSAESYVGGTLTLVGSQGYTLPAEDCEYNLDSGTSGFLTIAYAPDANTGTENTVLVLQLPAYGMAFATLPVAGQNNIAARAVVDNTLYILLENGMTAMLVTQVEFTRRNLTQAQAEQWMDVGSLPATRFSVTEYRLVDDGVYTEVLENGSQSYAEDHSAWMTFESNDGAFDFSWVSGYTYKWGVAASNNTNLNLSFVSACQYDTNSNVASNYVDNGIVESWRNGELRWRFPGVGTANNTLVEIESVKLYMPDERLRLAALRVSNGGDAVDYVTGWKIGPRQEDANGVYYMITPNVRYFNAVTAGGMKTYFGFSPTFALVSAGEPLPANDYQVTGVHDYTDYEAADTVVTYRVAGEADSRTLTQTGPKVRVISQNHFYSTFNAYEPARFPDNGSSFKTQSNVVIGTTYTHTYNYTNNAWYVNNVRSAAATEEMIPGLNGKIIQTYDFSVNGDAAIQPKSITISSVFNSSKANCVLSAIVYTTLDGETHEFSQAQINAFNSSFLSESSSTTFTFPADIVTDDNRVTGVEVHWEKLYADVYRSRLAVKTYQYNGTTGSGASLNHTLSHMSSDAAGSPFYMERVSFAYKVAEYHDDARTVRCAHQDESFVHYALQAYTAEDPDNVRYSTSQDLYFRLVDPSCPQIYCTTNKSQYAQTGYYFMTEGEPTPEEEPYPLISVGSIGVTIGTYGQYRDFVSNPRINIAAASSPGGLSSISYLPGIFNCGPKMSGWTFDYTVYNPTTDDTLELHYTVPELTATTRVKLPVGDSYIMQSGYYLRSLSMHYDGVLDLSHADAASTTTQIVLLKDVFLCPLRYNPFTGARLTISSVTQALFTPTLYFGDCTCEDNRHITGQSIAAADRPGCNLMYMRTASLTRDAGTRSASSNTIPQGQAVTVTIAPKLKVVPADRKQFRETSSISARGQDQGSSHPITVPWGVNDTVYIELTDTANFSVDYANSTFYGNRFTSANVTYELITVTDPNTGLDRVFVKLFMPRTASRSGDPAIYSAQWATRLSGGLFIRNTQNMSSNIYVSGEIKLRLVSLPGAEEGVHYPIGEIYYDYSELLRMYDAPRFTGYDNDVTNYTISGVRDTLGLAAFQTASEANIIRDRLGEGGNLATPITVTKTGNVGNTIVPGVGISYAADYHSTFTSADRENPSELSVVMGAFQSAVYNFNTYQALPRAGHAVTYVDADQVEHTALSDLTLMLSDEIGVLSFSPAEVTGITVAYTTDAAPGESSTYVPAAEVSDWRAVTGFKLHVDYMPADSTVRLKVPLYADQKTALGDLNGYAGGIYTAQVGAPDAEVAYGVINLAQWTYTDAVLTGGSVFWDLLNENGTRDTANATQSGIESLIAGLPVTLYAPDGVTVIDETVTAAAASAFSLHTYLADPGQIIKIGLPDGSGATVKLTKTSASAIGTSQIDNDFKRDVSVNPLGADPILTLPAIPAAGITNISAAFVKLPQVSAPDVWVCEGQTVDVKATMTEFFRNALPAGAYNITFGQTENTAVAEVTETTVTLTGADKAATQQFTGQTAVTGVSPGETAARVSVKNTLGDEVTFEYVIHVTAHDWEFTGFTWTGSDEDGYTAAVANYKCENGETHYATVDASLTCVHTDPTCEAPGSDVYTAYVSAADSLDGEEHTEVKTVPIDPIGHNWVFTGFTWTGNDTEGYTAAVANYKCENGETHYATVNAAFTSAGTEPTCESAGNMVYTASVTEETGLDGEAHSEEKTVAFDPLGHDWDTPVWDWTDETVDGETVYTRVTCTVPCKRDHAHDLVYATDDDAMHITLAVSRTPAGCETEGSVVYTATVDADAALTDSRTVTLTAVGHIWGEPTWTWTSHEVDGVTVYDSATAHFVCGRDENHVRDLTDDELDIVTVAAKCEEDGSVKYTAIVEFNGEAYTDDKTVTLTAVGHLWGEPTWTWTSHEEDGVTVYDSATAHFVCARDDSHTRDLTDDELDVETTLAGCEENGSVKYIAIVEFGGETYTDSRTVILSDAPGHNWEFTGFTWTGSDAAGYTAAVANYVCNNGEPHYATVNAEVTSERTEPTCTEAGVVVYTAAVSEENSLDAQAHAEEKTVVLPALGHDWGPWTVVREATFEEDGLERRVCNRCGLVEERVIVWQGNATREIQFVVSYPMHYIVHMRNVDYSVYSETIPVIYWYPEYPLTFDILIYSSWGLDGYIISANGKEIKPDANGVYTIPAGEEKVQINCDPIVTVTSAGQEICEYCGKVHPSTVWGFLTGMIHRLFTYIKKMGG